MDFLQHVPFASQNMAHARLDHCGRPMLGPHSLFGLVGNASLASGTPAAAVPLPESELEESTTTNQVKGTDEYLAMSDA